MTYRILNILLWPLWFGYTLRVTWRDKDLRYFKQRLGYGYPLLSDSPVWIHCASVGEVNTWLPLHHVLATQYPALNFVITTNTPTGAKIVEKNALKNTRHLYLPMDTMTAVARFFNCVKPRLALVMETELWPELYRQCHGKNIPLVMVNARLSHKTRNASDWVKRQYFQALQRVAKILCRTQADADGYIELGANKNSISVLGNLKFAAPATMQYDVPKSFTQRSFVLAASTHADEELQLARLWQSFAVQDYLLVIAPRHPQRRDEILRQLQALNLNIAVRSRGDAITQATQLYLADTLGELMAFMAQADVVLMGGSLVPRGGQNLLEPARLGKMIIVGPHMFNFAAETELFLQHRACLQVQNIEELGRVLQSVLLDPNARSVIGHNAQQLMQNQQGVADRYLAAIRADYDDMLRV